MSGQATSEQVTGEQSADPQVTDEQGTGEHVLIVGPGRDLPTRVRRARPGNRTTVICRLESVARVREITEHSAVLALPSDAPDEEWIALAAAAHARHPFTRIAGFLEFDQRRCAVIGEALGLATHPPRTVDLVCDKDAMRARLRERGVDSTASARVADLAQLEEFAAEFGFPCIVKPVEGAGSRGVARVDRAGELAAALARAGGEAVVEQFHEGPQYSVEAFSEEGEHQVLAVTRKFSDPATFVELGHVSPAELTDAREKEIRAYAERVLDALDVRYGPTHTEIVLGAEGPRCIETHLRMGGDRIPYLTRDSTGVDLAECTVRQTVGEAVLPGIRAVLAEPREPVCHAIWFAALPAAGVLTGTSGLDEARAVPGVTEVDLLVDPGSTVGGLDSSWSRVGYARACGPTEDAAVGAAREAVSRLGFQLQVRAGEGQAV
ncbi:ATP-grasp domain-containing protein [Streptomyces sp. NPDC021093]|uniref:ATP-grasp domain-containing protein n=1 Tax=Streptomyces sp. NPDC021093 TaxID=3365112 RepID=UPI0037BD85BC